jgi:uncharacterized cupin superfamily protein
VSAESEYAKDFAAIEQDLAEAQSLEFGAYVGFMAHYGVKLRQLAEKHPSPEGAFRHLQAHADEFLERLNGR